LPSRSLKMPASSTTGTNWYSAPKATIVSQPSAVRWVTVTASRRRVRKARFRSYGAFASAKPKARTVNTSPLTM